jgi:hypothetical protein
MRSLSKARGVGGYRGDTVSAQTRLAWYAGPPLGCTEGCSQDL